VRLLLDTAVLVWAIESPERLSKRVVAAIETPDNVLEASAVSLGEIAIKSGLGKLRFPAASLREALRDLSIRILPYTAEHAFFMFDLPLHHRDPFDRQIIAQALAEKIPVVTPDHAFRLYKGLKSMW
jgi:PIN domain nuclease of toxin-antitoxin system